MTLIVFYLVQGFLFSYLSIGLVCNIAFNFLNKNEANQNKTEIITCNITRFWAGKQPSVDFKYCNRHHSFKIDYDEIMKYEGKQPANYKLEVLARKGLWNYYLVDNWTIKSNP